MDNETLQWILGALVVCWFACIATGSRGRKKG